MRKISKVTAMQRYAAECGRSGTRVALVPTMGCLHAGHMSLVHKARKQVGPGGRVVVSIYVNPTQFAANEDLDAYPRTLDRDLADCRAAGVDVVFMPSDSSMYPDRERGGYSTYVNEENLSASMEGGSRPTHFRGVTTVVAKLFNIVRPDVAIFGAKDWQQAAIIRRMVRDLNMAVKITVAPTVREADGLAMSSRNANLSPAERAQADVLYRSLRAARAAVRAAGSVSAAKLRSGIRRVFKTAPLAKLDYVEFFHPDTLEPVRTVSSGTRMALAARFSRARLIDNERL
ncbi:MAG: pantoate--beta-alanine ligase [Verrucomicrobiae bacterium]|nr:pantoate--beta-alanine ligase [Verrucomicrobiae bacterium]